MRQGLLSNDISQKPEGFYINYIILTLNELLGGVTMKAGDQLLQPSELLRVYNGIARYVHDRVAAVQEMYGPNQRVLVLGIESDGAKMVDPVRKAYGAIGDSMVTFSTLDVSLHRDDFRTHPNPRAVRSDIVDLNYDFDGAHIILLDNVLNTGRTLLAGIDAVHEYGRPQSVAVAVIYERGEREVPLVADFALARDVAIPQDLVAKLEHVSDDSSELTLILRSSAA